MENKFYEELETLATYPLFLLSKEERQTIVAREEHAPLENLNDDQRSRIANQIDRFLNENEQYLSEHIHEVRIIDSINKLREKCDMLGIPWEKAHIVQIVKRLVGGIQSKSPIVDNLPNDILLPFFLTCSESVPDLKKVFQDNERMRDMMSDPHAIKKLCRSPFYEWRISANVAVDFLSEFAATVNNLQVDFSFLRDLDDRHLRKLAKSCPNIIAINLSGCTGITDKGIEHFKANHHLRHIYCFDCENVSEEEQKHLRKLLPHCSIYG